MLTSQQSQPIQKDPVIREALNAGLRTGINIAITLADFFPGFGEALSWAADIGKLSKKTDLTPDVSKAIAWGTEVLEFVSWGTLPSHVIETVLQLSHDWPRITAGMKRWQGKK